MSRARRANATAIAPIDVSRGAEVGLPSHNRHPGPARCWASSLSKRDSRTSLYLRRVSVAGKRNSEPRDNSAENACSVSLVSAETRTRAAEPANSGPFGSSQEISPNVGLPGGPGRTRTSNQTVMSGGIKVAAVDFPEHLAEVERVCSVSLRSFLVRNWCGNRQAL